MNSISSNQFPLHKCAHWGQQMEIDLNNVPMQLCWQLCVTLPAGYRLWRNAPLMISFFYLFPSCLFLVTRKGIPSLWKIHCWLRLERNMEKLLLRYDSYQMLQRMHRFHGLYLALHVMQSFLSSDSDSNWHCKGFNGFQSRDKGFKVR